MPQCLYNSAMISCVSNSAVFDCFFIELFESSFDRCMMVMVGHSSFCEPCHYAWQTPRFFICGDTLSRRSLFSDINFTTPMIHTSSLPSTIFYHSSRCVCTRILIRSSRTRSKYRPIPAAPIVDTTCKAFDGVFVDSCTASVDIENTCKSADT